MHEARALASADICVVLVSAVSRTTSKKGGGYNAKELGMGSFRESSEIEYGCDDCFVMYREDEQRADSRDGQKIVHLKHVKSRNNMQQDLRFGFDGAIQRFELLPDRDADEDAVEMGPIVPISPGRVSRGNSSRASLIDPFSFDMG
jgi:replicative DNA helicase